MKSRFEGGNRSNLIDVLRKAELTANNPAVADALATKGELVEFKKGEDVIVQNGSDNDVYFLLVGVVGIIANGAQIATRSVGQHVGEMSALVPSLPRSATVVALENVVVLKVSAAGFLDVLKEYSETALPLAQELAKRLYQRNSTIRVPNESAKLFIISSSEAKKIAHALRDGLGKDVFTTVWDQGVFFAGGYPLEALENMVAESDFAVAIAEPDDITQSRGVSSKTVRDNVLFELGLFMGKLTRYRSILVHPRVKDLKLPSDLQGLTLVPYEDGDEATITTRLAPVCTQIGELIKKLGTRKFTIE